MSKSDIKIAIIGLGYVGLPLAVEFAKKYQVIGFDINQNRIEELEKNNDSTLEIKDEAISSVRGNLNFTSNINDTKDCNIYIVCIPTPIDEFNKPNLEPLISSSKSVGTVIKKDDIIIYESTVYPGVTEDVCVKELEQSSGLIFNKDFFCGYSPERINPGDKVNTLTKIIKITSGSTPEIADKIDELYKSIITAGTYKASSIKVAEAAKVIENTQRDLNIAFTNELSVILGRLNLDTIEVLEAAGSKWNFLPFRPGLVGGHCIGVDPYYLTHAAEQVNYNPQVILAGRRINDNMGFYMVKKVIQQMINNGIRKKK
jgi:UDP-N-acetyl-D-galactosamine dehydrogenase